MHPQNNAHIDHAPIDHAPIDYQYCNCDCTNTYSKQWITIVLDRSVIPWVVWTYVLPIQ